MNHFESIRHAAIAILEDGEEHTLHDILIACVEFITPEIAARAYITEYGTEASRNTRKLVPLEKSIAIGRYIVIKNAIRTLVVRGKFIRRGIGMDVYYRKAPCSTQISQSP